MPSEDEDILAQARAFREGDDAALVRLVALVLRGTSPASFRDRLLEFVRPEVEGRVGNDIAREVVRVCPFCVAPIFHTAQNTTGRLPRPIDVKVEVELAEDWRLMAELCDRCLSMDGRYPEVLSFLRRATTRLWRFAGAPPESLRS